MPTKSEPPFSPKARLEWLQAAMVVLLAGLTLYVYQDVLGLHFSLKQLGGTLQLPLFAVVILPYLTYVLVRSDPLQRNRPRGGATKFFQDQYPSKYILERCKSCREGPSCNNRLTEDGRDHENYWLDDIFHGPLERQRPESIKRTFERSYTCKLIFASEWLLGVSAAISLVVAAFHLGYQSVPEGRFALLRHPLQIAFPVLLLIALWVIAWLNRIDDKNPTGCCAAWKQVNNGHIVWMRDHDYELARVVCHARGNQLTFKPR
jgi:hypothetical protein